MSQKILQLNFNFDSTAKEYENLVSPLAQQFADVPGCLWKIWMINEAKMEAGGIYLFESEEAVNDFKQTPLVAAVLNNPALSNFSVKDFSILEEISLVTRAPITEKAKLSL